MPKKSQQDTAFTPRHYPPNIAISSPPSPITKIPPASPTRPSILVLPRLPQSTLQYHYSPSPKRKPRERGMSYSFYHDCVIAIVRLGLRGCFVPSSHRSLFRAAAAAARDPCTSATVCVSISIFNTCACVRPLLVVKAAACIIACILC